MLCLGAIKIVIVVRTGGSERPCPDALSWLSPNQMQTSITFGSGNLTFTYCSESCDIIYLFVMKIINHLSYAVIKFYILKCH